MHKLPPNLFVLLRIIVFLFLIVPIAAFPVQSQTPTPSPKQSIDIDPDDVIRVKTELVNSPVLVIGREGKFIPTLKRDDFEVYEQGVKQNIAYFSPVESPYTFVILIDTSRSTFFSLEDIKSSASSFVERHASQ